MKTIFQSKTVWFNIIVFGVALLALPQLINVLPSSFLQYDVLGGAIGNLILRIWFTTQPIVTPTVA